MASDKDKKNKIDVVVVVSGVPRPAELNVHEPLRNLVRDVLSASGDAGRDPAEFELRTDDGRLLDLSSNALDAGLASGTTLFLNPRAGAGG
jgi:hypothetical protein